MSDTAAALIVTNPALAMAALREETDLMALMQAHHLQVANSTNNMTGSPIAPNGSNLAGNMSHVVRGHLAIADNGPRGG